MKMIFVIILVTLFLFYLMMYAAFYKLLKEQFDMKENDGHEED